MPTGIYIYVSRIASKAATTTTTTRKAKCKKSQKTQKESAVLPLPSNCPAGNLFSRCLIATQFVVVFVFFHQFVAVVVLFTPSP